MYKDRSFIDHGGDIYTEGKLIGVDLLDFSSNINFLGVPESFQRNISKALENLISYPDIKYRETKFYIKEYLKYGIKEENIILGNGSAEIISLAVGTLQRPCIVVPSFTEYEAVARNHKGKINFSFLNEDFTFNYRNIMEQMMECDGLVIANPNNPNGGVIDKEAFMKILNYCEAHDKKIIIDEAFIEFINYNHQSFIDLCMKYKCIFIIRALTKFFAMPGIRFGYGICSDQEYIERLSKLQIPWNINSFAEIAVQTVLKDRDYIHKSKVVIAQERDFFRTRLKEFKFVGKVYDSQANFLLVKLKGASGEGVFDYCIDKGILIRRCSNFRGLNDSFIRLAVKSRKDNNKLLTIFKIYDEEIVREDVG